jgi:glycosyltransferase involved in cell wall biosynthesis
MNILFLTQILPYPPNAGPRVKTWHVLRYLAERGHKVTLVSFIRPEELAYIEDVKQVCQAVHTIPISRSRLTDLGYLIRSQFTGRPFLIERDDIAEFRHLIDGIMASEQIDIIHADQLTMTQFALPYAQLSNGKPVLIFDAHNAVWAITERMKENAPFYFQLPLMLETHRIKHYEGDIIRKFQVTLAVTEPDRKALIKAMDGDGPAADARIAVIPIAVDTAELQPVERKAGSFKILTMGTLHYPPNADGIRWFVEKVFPLIRLKTPEARLTIIGKSPPKDFLKLAKQPGSGIVVTGFVPELDPYFAESALAVIPVRAGGGMRVRILEAFARAMPVVTTTVGLEGIEARPGEDVLVADSPAQFADSVIRLLSDRDLQAKLARNGRCLAESRYEWQIVLKDLDSIYQQLG